MFNKFFNKNKEEKSVDNFTKRILVVEDNPTDRILIEVVLKKQGYNVISVENGSEAIKSALVNKFDLIVSDLQMPVLSGIDMLKILKDYSETENVPIIFLTAHDTPSNVIEVFELNAENCLSKPINSKELIGQVEQILKEK